MKLQELITETLGNVKFASDSYITQACLALGTINGEVTWDEEKHIISVCGVEILACGIIANRGVVSFKINSMNTTLEYPIEDIDAVRLVSLTELLAEERDHLNIIDATIGRLLRVDLRVDISANDGGFDIDSEDLSTDTMAIIRDAVIGDLSIQYKEKRNIIDELQLQIDEINAKIKANTRVKYRWTLPVPCMWSSFDYGIVEASSIEEARELSLADLKEQIRKINEILKPHGHSVDTNYEIDVVLEEKSN